MNPYGCFSVYNNRLGVREFSTEDVSYEIRLKGLNTARLKGTTGLNTQHYQLPKPRKSIPMHRQESC